MIYLELFWAFMKIGLFTIGGGYAMIPLMREEIVTRRGWLDGDLFLSLIGIAESTPGPCSVNIATFVGYSQAGVLGSAAATLGLVAPSFVIILIIAKLFTKFSENKYVKRVFWGFKPVVVALVLSAAFTLFVQFIFPNVGLKEFEFDFSSANFYGLIIFAAVFAFTQIRIKKKKPHPALSVLLSAGLGVLIYGVVA